VKDEWRGNPEGTRQYVHQPVQTAEDWQKIQLFPMKGSKLFEQLRAFELVRKNTPDNTPVLPTIFSPLSQAKNLVGKENLVAHLRQSPDQVLGALQVITDLTLEFIQLLKTIHVDGIFFAVQQAQYSLLTREEFQKFGAAFDLQILDAAKDFWFNLGHLHGTHVMFDELSQYPVQVLNWHDLETYPGLDEGKKLFPRGGGVRWAAAVAKRLHTARLKASRQKAGAPSNARRASGSFWERDALPRSLPQTRTFSRPAKSSKNIWDNPL